MFARGLYSSRVGFVVIGALCGSCLASDGAGDDDKGQAPSAVGSASAGEGQAGFEWSQGKLIPAKLRDQPGVVTGDWLSAATAASQGPRASSVTNPPGGIVFTASSTSLWPGQSTTLTVDALRDVRPLTIDIWDTELGGVIASCSAGRTCSTSVTRANADHTRFIAVVGRRVVVDVLGFTVSTVNPEEWAFVDVTWNRSGLWLMETPTVPVIGVAALMAVTVHAIPSPLAVDIYDVTAGTRVARCTAGTLCPVTVLNPTNVNNPTTTTHRYRACVTSLPSDIFPPPNALECTADHAVSWVTAAPSVFLTVSPTTTGGFIAIGSTPIDVGPTPYWIQIYDVNSGARLAVCGFGTSCSATFPPGANYRALVAFAAPWSPTLPGPVTSGAPDQSNSNTVSMGPPTSGQGAAVVSGPVIGPPGIPGGIPF